MDDKKEVYCGHCKYIIYPANLYPLCQKSYKRDPVGRKIFRGCHKLNMNKDCELYRHSFIKKVFMFLGLDN